MFLIFIDVNESLSRLISIPLNDLNGLDSSLSNLKIPNGSFNNEMSMIGLNLNRFLNLESIEIGNDCFESVETFKIDGLNQLKTIKIGINSFTKRYGNDKSKSFHILNCESLESIKIGEFSFSDFGGKFELKNLPQLQSIQIGSVLGTSNNFCHSSFVIRGIELILNI